MLFHESNIASCILLLILCSPTVIDAPTGHTLRPEFLTRYVIEQAFMHKVMPTKSIVVLYHSLPNELALHCPIRTKGIVVKRNPVMGRVHGGISPVNEGFRV